MKFRVGILTISDKGHAGEREDTAGPELARLLDPQILPDGRHRHGARRTRRPSPPNCGSGVTGSTWP